MPHLNSPKNMDCYSTLSLIFYGSDRRVKVWSGNVWSLILHSLLNILCCFITAIWGKSAFQSQWNDYVISGQLLKWWWCSCRSVTSSCYQRCASKQVFTFNGRCSSRKYEYIDNRQSCHCSLAQWVHISYSKLTHFKTQTSHTGKYFNGKKLNNHYENLFWASMTSPHPCHIWTLLLYSAAFISTSSWKIPHIFLVTMGIKHCQ